MLPRSVRKIGLVSSLINPLVTRSVMTRPSMVTSLNLKPLMFRQRGAVAIIVALALPLLIGMAGLALDLGKLFITKTELQNAADACALSAARELNGTAAQFTAAETAGRNVGQANRAYFQTDAVVLPVNDAVRFSTALDGAYQPANALAGLTPAQAATFRFVRCTANKGNIANWLIEVLNVMPGIAVAGEQTVQAAAVATLGPGQNSCNLLPIGICNTAVTATTPAGTWINGILAPGSGTLSGSYRWVDFDPNEGGANEIRDLLTGNSCDKPIPGPGANVNEPGFKASDRIAYNTRFGLSQGGTNGVPDSTGFSYYPTANPPVAVNTNVYANFLTRRATNTAYQGDTASGIALTGGTSIRNSAYLAANGRSRRIMVAPVVNCATMTMTTTAPTYACMLLLHPMKTQGAANFNMYMQYLGNANAIGECNQSGVAGGAGSTGPLVTFLVQ